MNLLFRPITYADAELLLTWRNDPQTCAMSRVKTTVTWPDHLKYLSVTFSSQSRAQFIVEAEGVPVGTCRADRFPKTWILSWTVAPEHRRKGYGGRIAKWLAENYRPAWAHIEYSNEPSLKIARRAGIFVHVMGVHDEMSSCVGSRPHEDL